MSDDQDINELKTKLQEQAAEFQSYKEQCKHIQQMLEEQCQKKQSQIKQLKQQAIKRQKGEKMLKAQVSQLQAEVANLKTQLGDSVKSQSQSASHKEELDAITKESSLLKEKNNQLESKLQEFTLKVTQLQSELNQATNKIEELKKALSQSQHKAKSTQPSSQQPQQSTSPSKDSHKLEQQLKKLKQKLTSTQKDKSKLQKYIKQKQSQFLHTKHDLQQKIKKLQQIDSHSLNKPKKQQQKPSLKREQSQPKQLKQTISLSQHKHQISKLKQTIHQLQQRTRELQHADKDQKIKLTNVMNQKTALLQKFKKLSQQLQKQKEKRQVSQHQSPQKTNSQQIMIDDTQINQNNKEIPSLRMDSLLLTKKHYISPFIEIKDNKMIKVYKSTKNGFEKSLGATRHKFDSVGYDSQAIAQIGASFAKDSLQNGMSHSIVIYGSKKTSKKLMMCSILEKLRDWLVEKIDECQQNYQQDQNDDNRVHFKYLKHSVDSQIHEQKQSSNKQQMIQILDEIISSTSPTPSSSSSPSKKSKKNPKSKVRYLLFTFTNNLSLQIITTSYLNPFIKNNQTFIDYLNTIIYSKLPNILQSSQNNYHIITLINPIVSEYQQCKNTLSITMVPFAVESSSNNHLQLMTSTMAYSPATINKDDLNDLTKKKLESFEKETQQAGLRVRKIQDECNYFRTRFEQLQVRLKNLINTHQQQNTYLKKSPVTLSYQKLLKFVNSVLARNSSIPQRTISPNFGQPNEDYYQSQNHVNMYIEEDAKSLDGY